METGIFADCPISFHRENQMFAILFLGFLDFLRTQPFLKLLRQEVIFIKRDDSQAH